MDAFNGIRRIKNLGNWNKCLLVLQIPESSNCHCENFLNNSYHLKYERNRHQEWNIKIKSKVILTILFRLLNVYVLCKCVFWLCRSNCIFHLLLSCYFIVKHFLLRRIKYKIISFHFFTKKFKVPSMWKYYWDDLAETNFQAWSVWFEVICLFCFHSKIRKTT